ncbi:MAG: GIY-YIG nuclease family protein [bacterium]
MYYVYILKSQFFDRLYIGSTSNPQERIKNHNAGLSKSTKPHRPWIIIHIEKYPTLSQARKRESFLKKHKSKKFLHKYVIKDAPMRPKADRDPDSRSRRDIGS